MPFLNLHQSRKLALSIWLMVNIIYIISLWHIARADQFHKSQTWALIKSGKTLFWLKYQLPNLPQSAQKARSKWPAESQRLTELLQTTVCDQLVREKATYQQFSTSST